MYFKVHYNIIVANGREIVDFKIKALAELFLELRAALYEDEMGEEMKNRFNSG